MSRWSSAAAASVTLQRGLTLPLGLVLGLVLSAGSAGAATVEQRHIHIEIQGDGSLLETTRLRVRLDTDADVARWTTYRTYLDDNRELEGLEAAILRADGRREAGVAGRDMVEASGSAFHASRRFHLLTFADLGVGDRIVVEQAIRHRPYYPASRVLLHGGEEVVDLKVTVSGADPTTWRHAVSGEVPGLEVEGGPGGVTVSATGLPPRTAPPLAPGGFDARPALRFGWGGDGSWDHVGAWLLGEATGAPKGPSTGGTVADLAAELTSDLGTPRERLETLTRFVQQDIRYLAVEVGEGGYRPSPPPEVLERRWGDCKDKTMLLVDLLAAVGIEARPAYVRSGRGRRLDPAFPSHDAFDHVVVAVPVAQLGAGEGGLDVGGAVADGWLFVDPTQGRGGAGWLHPNVQDQLALVAGAAGSILIRTPSRPHQERRSLVVDLDLDPGGVLAAGDARGTARLELTGELADRLLAELGEAEPSSARESARSLLAGLLPAATLGAVDWFDRSEDRPAGGAPAVEIEADVVIPGLMTGGSSSIRLPAMHGTPDPEILRGRGDPAVLPTRRVDARWRLRLPPDSCPPVARGAEVDNAVGAFRQSLAEEDGVWVVLRTTELRTRWVDRGDLPKLEALALAEHRTQRRRLRLRCSAPE